MISIVMLFGAMDRVLLIFVSLGPNAISGP